QRERADVDAVARFQSGRLVVESLGLPDEIDGAVPPCELGTPGDVVVVQMRLGDMRDAHAPIPCQPLDPVEVALRVDHHTDGTVMDQVAAIPQRIGANDLDVHDRPSRAGVVMGSLNTPHDRKVTGRAERAGPSRSEERRGGKETRGGGWTKP